MEWIIILSIALLFYGYFVLNKKKTQENQTRTIPENKNEFKKIDNNVKARTVNNVGKSVLLCKNTTFPLTLLNCDKSTAEIIRNILDSKEGFGITEQAKAIAPMLIEQGIQCKEMEDYIEEYKPIYLNAIELQIKNTKEWDQASKKDRDDLLFEFKQKATQQLEVIPYLGIDILFEEYSDTALHHSRELVIKYGFDNMRFYLRLSGNIDAVKMIPSNHRDRKRYEKLCVAGIAIRGTNIDLKLILDSLKLKQLNQLSKEQVFKRKAEAIVYLLQKPDTITVLGEIISFREAFKLIPIIDNSDLQPEIVKAFRYYKIVSELITHTYIFGKSSSRRKKGNMMQDLSVITGWEISSCGDGSTCSYCKKMSRKIYKKNDYPKTPLHIGCRCIPLAISKY